MTILAKPPELFPRGTYIALFVSCTFKPRDHLARVIAEKIDVTPEGMRGEGWRIDVAADPYGTLRPYPD